MLRIPVSHSVRNLKRRFWRSLVTATGIAVIVFGASLMLSLSRGLERRMDVTGEEENLLVISKAGQNLMFSSIPEDELVSLSTIEGLAHDALGSPLVSPEIMHMSIVEYRANGADVREPVYLRGVYPQAYEVHRSVHVTEGALPSEGNEILVGATAHIKMGIPEEATKPGQILVFEGKEWTISGRFTAGGSLFESEIWIDSDILKDLLRRNTSTFAVIRMQDKAGVESAMPLFSSSGSIERYFKGWPEKAYYREFGSALEWITWLSFIMVSIITVAGALIGANTMYTAVINRIREIATFRVLGFYSIEIMVSMLLESVLLSLAGGIAGSALSLAVNGLPFKLSYGAFYLVVDGAVVGAGIGLAVLIGLCGGFLPVLKGLRMRVIDGLRYS